jgi:hypothetical protein
MSKQDAFSDNGFPNWEELLAFIEDKAEANVASDLLLRIMNNRPNDMVGEGLKKYLQKKGHNQQTLRAWIIEAKKRPLKKRNANLFRNYKLAAAASVIIVLSLAIFYYLSQPDRNQWMKWYKTDPGFPILMGNSDTNNLWMQQYRYRNYQTALELMEAEEENDTLLFYKAVCFFELGDTEKSLANLKLIKEDYQDKAILLEAFCYWREGDQPLAKALFSNLCVAENGIPAAEACAIIKSAF